jgi:hypothetical protein
MLLCASVTALALLGGGCRKRSAQAAPPVVIVPSPDETRSAPQPTPTKGETKPAEPQPTAPTTKPPELVVPPARRSSPRTAPAPKPAPVETLPTTEPAPPRPAPPKMSPRLSPREQAEYEKKTSAAISLAEKNLQLANGRALNAAQLDLVEKIRGFLGQAREAARAGDWQRAYNLAQKAEVLSKELVNSL